MNKVSICPSINFTRLIKGFVAHLVRFSILGLYLWLKTAERLYLHQKLVQNPSGSMHLEGHVPIWRTLCRYGFRGRYKICGGLQWLRVKETKTERKKRSNPTQYKFHTLYLTYAYTHTRTDTHKHQRILTPNFLQVSKNPSSIRPIWPRSPWNKHGLCPLHASSWMADTWYWRAFVCTRLWMTKHTQPASCLLFWCLNAQYSVDQSQNPLQTTKEGNMGTPFSCLTPEIFLSETGELCVRAANTDTQFSCLDRHTI